MASVENIELRHGPARRAWSAPPQRVQRYPSRLCGAPPPKASGVGPPCLVASRASSRGLSPVSSTASSVQALGTPSQPPFAIVVQQGSNASTKAADPVSIDTIGVKGGAAQRHLAGLALYDAGDFAGALAEYKLAMQEYQRAGAMQSLTGASLLRDMGTAKTRLYDFTGALENYEEAQSLLEGFGAMGTFDGARLLVNIGATKGNLGDIHGAMRYQQEAVKVMSLNDKERTKPGAVLLGNIGALRAQLGDAAGARVDFAKAEGILAALQLLGSPEGQTFLRQKHGAGF